MTASVSPERQAASASRRPGRARVVPVIDVETLLRDAHHLEGVALRCEVLGVCGDTRISDQEAGHRWIVASVPDRVA